MDWILIFKHNKSLNTNLAKQFKSWVTDGKWNDGIKVFLVFIPNEEQNIFLGKIGKAMLIPSVGTKQKWLCVLPD